MSLRLANINESYRETGAIIAEKTRQEWIDLLGETNVPMMVVNTLDELIEDPQLVGGGFWQEYDHPTEGRLRFSSPPMNFEKTPASIRRLPPRLGEHTRELLSEVGYEESHLAALQAEGAIQIQKEATL
jgi:crotonobetainyl-CoA:carnitine CoA-transferase CaiB-like acyl-CoA transferase